jgi:hypothetical protein
VATIVHDGDTYRPVVFDRFRLGSSGNCGDVREFEYSFGFHDGHGIDGWKP